MNELKQVRIIFNQGNIEAGIGYDDVTRIEETEEGGHMGLIRVYHISIKAAQALQSAGFDLPTSHYYPVKDTMTWNLVDSGTMLNHNQYKGQVSAPDILTAVLWLWEKYRAWASGYPSDGGKFRWDVSVEHRTGIGSYLDIADEGTATDILAAYNTAIIAACEWAKKQKT